MSWLCGREFEGVIFVIFVIFVFSEIVQARGVTQPYTLQLRTRLFSSAGPETAFQWSYVVCSTTQYARPVGNDSVTCEECPTGGDCSGLQLANVASDSELAATTDAADVSSQVTAQLIVAMPGYWTAPASESLTSESDTLASATTAFYACPNPAACLPGSLVNGR